MFQSLIAEANNELVDLESSADCDRVKYSEDGAPLKDQPHSWDQQVFERVDNFMLEQVRKIQNSIQL